MASALQGSEAVNVLKGSSTVPRIRSCAAMCTARNPHSAMQSCRCAMHGLAPLLPQTSTLCCASSRPASHRWPSRARSQ